MSLLAACSDAWPTATIVVAFLALCAFLVWVLSLAAKR